MKKFLVIILSIVIILSLVACGSVDASSNASNGENETRYMLGKSAMIELGDGLWYDSTTRIVYWWNGCLKYQYNYSTTPSPYYAPNGLPYRYNHESNMFEEIDIDG